MGRHVLAQHKIHIFFSLVFQVSSHADSLSRFWDFCIYSNAMKVNGISFMVLTALKITFKNFNSSIFFQKGDTITLDNPQNTLWTVFIKTISSVESRSNGNAALFIGVEAEISQTDISKSGQIKPNLSAWLKPVEVSETICSFVILGMDL